MRFVVFSVGTLDTFDLPLKDGDSVEYVYYCWWDRVPDGQIVLYDPDFNYGDYFAASKVLKAYLDSVSEDHVSVFSHGNGLIPFCLAGMTGGQQFSDVRELSADERGLVCTEGSGRRCRVPPSSVVVMKPVGSPVPGTTTITKNRVDLGLGRFSVGMKGSKTKEVS